MDKSRFKELIVEALESLPPRFKERLENVDIVLEENMPQDFRRGGMLLGLYSGIPLKKRSVWHSGNFPDKITLYKNNIERVCRSEAEVRQKIKDVLYHEIGHHFGLKEEELR